MRGLFWGLTTLLAVAVLEAGCAEPPPPTPESLLQHEEQGLRISVRGTPGTEPSYLWQKHTYDGSSAFMEGVDREIAKEIDRVPVQNAALGSLRLVMPIRSALTVRNDKNPKGAEEAEETAKRYFQATDDGRLAALRKASIFAPIRVSVEQVGVADNQGADFVLWYAAGHWHLRYHQSDTEDLNDFSDVAAWTNAVYNNARTAMHGYGANGLSFSAHFNSDGKGGIRFHFDGADYFSAAELASPMMDAWLKEAAEVRPVQHPIGRRVEIVLPVRARIEVPSTVTVAEGIYAFELRRATEASYAASTAGMVAAVRNSRMFEDVDVQTRDVADVPLGANDATIWRPASSPFQWVFRVAGQEDARVFKQPSSNSTLQESINALDVQMQDVSVP